MKMVMERAKPNDYEDQTKAIVAERIIHLYSY